MSGLGYGLADVPSAVYPNMKTAEATFELVDPISPDAAARLRRLRSLAFFLDRLFSFGGNRRFGVEPLIGLIPGLGDWIGGVLSLYILYEAARLGISWSVLGRMATNVLLETVVGTIPVAGDLFDFIWQANMRNVQLVESHYRSSLRPRPLGRIVFALVGAALLLFFLLLTLAVFTVRLLWQLFT